MSRILDNEIMGDEELVERTLRPQYLREYIGQDKVKDQLQIFIEAAKMRWQKRITSASLLPLGSKSLPPLPPPMGSVVSAFLKHCSKARNLRIDKFTLG